MYDGCGDDGCSDDVGDDGAFAPILELTKTNQFFLTTGLPKFFEKVRDIHFNLKPKVYQPSTFSPKFLKEATDKSNALYTELNNIIINENLLTPRENRMLAQFKHFLKHSFGSPYYNNYYTGMCCI